MTGALAAAGKLGRRAPAQPDAAQVARAQRGDAAAFDDLVRHFGGQLFRFLLLRLGNETDARDALQETLVAAWRGLPSLRDAGSFHAWLVGIAARKAADLQRGTRWLHGPAEEQVAPETSADGLALREAIAGLPSHLREVVLLRYLLCLSEAETAHALGIRLGTVKSRAARARSRLQEVIGDDD